MSGIALRLTERHDRRRRTALLPDGLFRYVLATSWMHQFPVVALTIAVFLLEVVPLELQRRVVNDIAKHRPYAAVLLLCAAYLGAVAFQGAAKLCLNIYRAWIGERARRYLRRRIHAMVGTTRPEAASPEAQGTAVSMLVAEVEPVGGFIGSSLSEPLLQTGILLTVIAYITHIDPWMGGAALMLFLPQLVFVPLMQGAMNRRAGARVWLLRQIGAGVISGGAAEEAGARTDDERIDRVFQLDMGIFRFKYTMNFLMNLCSHLQVIAALLLGGWWVLQQRIEIGAVVAFISGVGRLNDPWGDLVDYFRDANLTRVKFDLLVKAAAPIFAGRAAD
jgi:ABC-type multidrug transport system fused ATPase/permease subunit